MNSNKTQLNNSSNIAEENRTQINDSSFSGNAALQIGTLIENKYEVKEQMTKTSGEADLYICDYRKKSYVAKVYRRKQAIKDEVLNKLKNIKSNCIARIYRAGHINGYPYEILPYYINGSLEGRKFSLEDLKRFIIPNLNEGLKILHDNGIIHKDLKPANIMMGSNRNKVAIIDFGISSAQSDGATVIVTKTGMTPDYSAPETFKNIFLKESDYYSLGITIYELYCGHTPYGDMSEKNIEQFISVQKIPLPDNMPVDLKELISALTYYDISNRKDKSNPNRRWGYEEVSKWLQGVRQQIPGSSSVSAAYTDSYIDSDSDETGGIEYTKIKPYKFQGKIYTNIKDLVFALGSSWEEGKKHLFRGKLREHFKGDTELAEYCKEAEDKYAGNSDEAEGNAIFFKTLYKLSPSLTAFFWNGFVYNNISEFASYLLGKLINYEKLAAETISVLLRKKILSFYLRIINKKLTPMGEKIEAIEYAHSSTGDERELEFNRYLALYHLSGSKSFYKYGAVFNSIRELADYLRKQHSESEDVFNAACEELIYVSYDLDPCFEAWLTILGRREEIEKWEKDLGVV